MSNYLNRIDLNALLLFYEVVNAESIRQASARLHVPKATISRKLRQLEQAVGAVLLKRGPQKLSVTDTGAALYEHCERIVSEVRDASFALSDMQSQLSGVLRISVPYGFGSEWLGGAIGRFALQYPNLEIYMRAAVGWVDVSEEQVDVVINIGRIRNEALPATRLGELSRGLYASPEYCARAGLPERPADLLPPGLPKLREQLHAKGLPEDDETAVLFAMFPQQVEALYKPKPPAPAPAPAAVASPPAPPPVPAPALAPARAPVPAAAPPPTHAGANGVKRHFAITVNGVRRAVTVQEV